MGVSATTAGAGNVSVTVVNGATASASGAGIVATPLAKPAAMRPSALLGGNVDGGAACIAAIVATATGAGAATIDQSGAVNSFTGGFADLAQSVNGAATVNVNGNIDTQGFDIHGGGAEALSTGTGEANVDLFSNVVPVGDPAQTQAAAIAITTILAAASWPATPTPRPSRRPWSTPRMRPGS